MAGGIGGRLDDRTISAWIQNAKAGAAEKKKLFDGGGLFLTAITAATNSSTAAIRNARGLPRCPCRFAPLRPA
jgi:hypothetical protein